MTDFNKIESKWQKKWEEKKVFKTKNNSKENLLGLCPNHHKMLHDFRYRREMLETLKGKGFDHPKDQKLDFSPS